MARVTRSELLERINATGKHIPTPQIISSGKSITLVKSRTVVRFERDIMDHWSGSRGCLFIV